MTSKSWDSNLEDFHQEAYDITIFSEFGSLGITVPLSYTFLNHADVNSATCHWILSDHPRKVQGWLTLTALLMCLSLLPQKLTCSIFSIVSTENSLLPINMPLSIRFDFFTSSHILEMTWFLLMKSFLSLVHTIF